MSNILDNVIAYIAPDWGMKRARSRVAIEAYRSYEGASRSRRTSDWKATGASANIESRGALSMLRNRAREQDRNNGYARKAINVITTNTVGSGIRPSLKEDVPNRENTMKAWNEWADYKQCDFDDHFNFYGIQKLVMRTVALSGEVLVIRERTKFKNKKTIPLQLKVLEPDFLDHHKDNSITETGARIVQGIEFDKSGKRAGYWLFDRHPGDDYANLNSTFIKASEVIHVYLKDRPGQERGISFGASTMITLRDFKDYQDAQLLKQKIATCFAMFVQKDNPDSEEFESSEGQLTEQIEPGMIQYLNPGETATFPNPPTTSDYGEHTKKKLQEIAAGYGITYEALSGDLANVNFSSGRMGWLEFHRQVTDWQYNMIIPILCDTVFAWWCEAAVIVGIIQEPVRAEWTAPRREMIDPGKEIKAMKDAVRSGFMSLSEALREIGYDPDNMIAELSSDMDKLKKLGLVLDTDPRNDLATVSEDKPK